MCRLTSTWEKGGKNRKSPNIRRKLKSIVTVTWCLCSSFYLHLCEKNQRKLKPNSDIFQYDACVWFCCCRLQFVLQCHSAGFTLCECFDCLTLWSPDTRICPILMGQDSASSRVSVFYPVLLMLLVLSCVLLGVHRPGSRRSRRAGVRWSSACWGSGLSLVSHVFLVSCAQTASMEGTFSAKPLLGHARPDPLRPCYLSRVHPDFPCVWPSTRI